MLQVAEIVEDCHEAFYLDLFWTYFRKLYHSTLLLSEDEEILKQYAPQCRKQSRHPMFVGFLKYLITGSFLIGSAWEGTTEAAEAFGVLSYDCLYYGYKKRRSIYNFDLMMLQFMKLRELIHRILRYSKQRKLYFQRFEDETSRVLDILMEKDYKFISIVTHHLSAIVQAMQDDMHLLLKNIPARVDFAYTEIMLFDYIKIIDSYTITPSVLFRQFQKFEDLITLITSNFLSCIIFTTSQKKHAEKIGFIKCEVGSVIYKLGRLMKKHVDEINTVFEKKQLNDDSEDKENVVKEKEKPTGNLAVTRFLDLYISHLQIARDTATAINEAYKEGAYDSKKLHGELQKLTGEHDKARNYAQMLIGLTATKPPRPSKQKSDLDLKIEVEVEIVNPALTVNFDDPDTPITDEEYELQMDREDEFTQTLYNYCMETQTDELLLRKNAQALLQELAPLLEERRAAKERQTNRFRKNVPPPPPLPVLRIDSKEEPIRPPVPPPLPGLTDEEVEILQNEGKALFQDLFDQFKITPRNCEQETYGDED